jgi:glutathione S-transferase
MRSLAWLIAALNSVEPAIFELINIDIFSRGQEWTRERRPQVVEKIEAKLKLLADALGDKDWFEDRFTIGDLMMVSVLRNLRHTNLVAGQPRLAAFVERGEARPAFQRALHDQLTVFSENQPQAA